MMKKIVTSLILASSLFATDFDSEISATIGGNLYEANEIEHDLAYGLRYGIKTDKYMDEIEFMIDRVSSEIRESGIDNDITRGGINAIYDIPKTSYFSPYFLVGAGYEDVEHEVDDKYEDSPYLNYGLGLRYEITEDLHLKTELRHLYKTASNNNELVYTVGLAIPFGKKHTPVVQEKPKPMPKPVAKPKPMPKPEPKPVVVQIDSDKDGVFDSMDKCPNTPTNFIVDQIGCEICFNFQANFDTDKAIIKDEFKPTLVDFAKFLQDTPYDVEIHGHTDSRGSEKYNQALSERRAVAIRDYLIKLNIEPNRLKAIGFGEAKPIADNATKDGRYKNRRVIAVFCKQESK
jgi:OOP family OmpA-OmpF porin